MENPKLEIKVAIQIAKPEREVFEAIVDPLKMANYFIKLGSARMEDGTTVSWRFPEFDMDVPIKVGKIEKDKYLSFHWGEAGKEQLTEIFLHAGGKGGTVITITEKEKENNEEGIKWLKSNTEGWANFAASLKAYLEYGINLRKGAFDFMKENS